MNKSNDMLTSPKLILPAGTITVTVRQIPHVLALSLYPSTPSDDDSERFLHDIFKRRMFFFEDEAELGELEPLSNSDWDVLFKLWQYLPPFRSGLTESEWKPYFLAFSEAYPWSDYDLCPVWDNITDLRNRARVRCTSLLHEAIRAKLITLRDSSGMPIVNPTDELLMSTEITVSELEEFFREYGVNGRNLDAAISTSQGSSEDLPGTVDMPNVLGEKSHSYLPGSWQAQAYELGKAWMLSEEARTGKRPGQTAIAAYLEGELSNRGIKGPRGLFLDRETIRREALKGITGRPKNGTKLPSR